MRTLNESRTYELSPDDHLPFHVEGNNIEVVGPPERVPIRVVYHSPDDIMLIRGDNLTFRNIEFDVDFSVLGFDPIGQFHGVLCQSCR